MPMYPGKLSLVLCCEAGECWDYWGDVADGKLVNTATL